MTHHTYLTSGEFAKLCDTSKETLRHYKDVGLLPPAHVGENGYQYYDPEQFYDFYAISIFKKTGTSLSKIKECMSHQQIPTILQTLQKQQKALAIELKKVQQMQFVVDNSIQNMKFGVSSELAEFTPEIAFFNEEHLLAVPSEEFSITEEERKDENRMFISILRRYKELCDAYDVHTDFQLGAIMPLDDFTVTHLYTRVRTADSNPYYHLKPAGNYLYLLLKRTWDASEGYEKLSNYIEQQKIETVGDLYAYDLAGFMINGTVENTMTLLSIRVKE